MPPEEQESIQELKDPSVITSANGTTHTTEEATVCVCDLDMFVHIQLLKESPAVLPLGKLCEENAYSYEGHPGQQSYLIKNGKKIKVVASVQATGHQTKALGDWKQTRAVDHEQQMETE